MNPAAINSALQQIWANASQSTLPYYIFGDARATEVYNWVIRWLVYKRFRYTDRRNLKRTTGSFDDDDDDDGDDAGSKSGPGTSKATLSPPKQGPVDTQPPSNYYDAARDGYRRP
ncbi:MAG: hypothetical protein M1830_002391 [Pleopsidium flavum]|nr:MAG: hypothetical protein M1830_002391 [Pleopsidium flavum]